MAFRYRYRPYEGLATLRGREIDPGRGVIDACEQADSVLGCVPSGRLHTLVFLAVAAAMMQRVRDDKGVPLFLVKGGLTWQTVLGDHARPTYDLDGSIGCSYDEFIGRAREALAEPWGCVSAVIENEHAFPANTVPYDLFFFNVHLSIDGTEVAAFPCEGSFNEPRFMLEPHAYPALALDVVGLPQPDALWGVTPVRGTGDKLFNLTEPLIPEGDPRYAGLVRPHRKAKHLVDAVLLSRLCGTDGLYTLDQLRTFVEARVAYDNDMRLKRGFVPFVRPLRFLDHEGWELEYLMSALQCGLDLSYDEAVEEISAFFERLDPDCVDLATQPIRMSCQEG